MIPEAIAVNTYCPWSGDPVSADSVTRYRGAPVAFCNPGCRDKFDKATALFDGCIADKCDGPMKAGFSRLAEYNSWMNTNLLDCILGLSPEELWQDRAAFFKSILGTLNHILVWDVTWLQRFAKQFGYASLGDISLLPPPTAHDQVLHEAPQDFADARRQMDKVIVAFIAETSERDYERTLTYTISTGAVFHKNFGGMLQHLFNHQTHHRGQIATLLSQMGMDPGTTDLLALLPEMAP